MSALVRTRMAELQPWIAPDQLLLSRPNTPTGVKLLLQADTGGAIDKEALFIGNRFIQTEFTTLMDGKMGFPQMSMRLNAQPVGTTQIYRVHAGARVVAENQRTGAQLVLAEHVREQTVRIGPTPDLRLPADSTHTDRVRQFAPSITMSRIVPASMDQWSSTAVKVSFTIDISQAPPYDAVYRIHAALPGRPPDDTGQVLRLDAGQELAGGSTGFMYFVNLMNDASTPDGATRAQAWRDATTADIHLIPDPESAYLHPPIGPITPIPLVIRNVPVITPDRIDATFSQHPPIPAELLPPGQP